jgi:glyoxylase-like metal-dependent hydrolase (beta-lactamase superfamily II)
MIPKKVTFTCATQFEDFISLGGGHVTAAICTSSPPLLFDPGVSAFGPLYLKKLHEHTRSTDNLIIALSHAHFDHCGAAAYLMRKIPTARLAASQKGSEILKRPNAVELICRLNAEYEKSMEAELAGEDVSFDALDVSLKLSNGDVIELDGGRVCQVFATPGHTRDSLSYFFPDTGIAFIGDAAGAPEAGFVHSPFLVSYEDYITSIEKIRVLRPAAICIPHCGILTGPEVSRYLSHALAAALEYKNWIEKYLALYKGNQEKVIARIAAEEYDAQTEHIQKRQPYILNLRAKVQAVAAWLEGRNR